MRTVVGTVIVGPVITCVTGYEVVTVDVSTIVVGIMVVRQDVSIMVVVSCGNVMYTGKEVVIYDVVVTSCVCVVVVRLVVVI